MMPNQTTDQKQNQSIINLQNQKKCFFLFCVCIKNYMNSTKHLVVLSLSLNRVKYTAVAKSIGSDIHVVFCSFCVVMFIHVVVYLF